MINDNFVYKYKYLECKIKYLNLSKKINNQMIGGNNGKKCILYENGILKSFNDVDDEKLNKNSQFLIGSLTKIFTIFTILLLHQNKLLDVNDKINKYIDSNEKNDFSQINILEVINHISGLKSMPDKKEVIYKKYINATDSLHSFIDEKLITHTKNTDNYSNIGYILLGAIIEKITKLSYIDVYKNYLFEPLKMNNTDIGETNITLYSKKCQKIKQYENNFKYWGQSAGGLYSSVNDLLKFANNVINLLNRESISILNKIYISNMNSDRGAIGHSGKIYGCHSRFYFTYEDNELKKIYIEFITCVSINDDIDEYYSKIQQINE